MVPSRRIGPFARSLALAVGSILSVAVAGTGTAGAAGIDAVEVTWPSPQLSVRATSHEPAFVGPGSLRLEGTRGSRRWREVRFGSDQVRAVARLVPAGRSCSARLRVMAADEPLAEASFHSTNGARGRINALVRVGYAHGGLRIDSDCREWSVRLVPLPDADLAASIEEGSYPVRGESIEQLTAQVDQVKGRWAAYSEWLTRWTITTRRAEDGSACEVTAGEAAVEVSLTLPDWRKPPEVDAAQEARWQAFVQSLLVHELGHVTIAIQGAAAIEHRLDAGFSASSCEEAGEQADAAARRIFERYARATRRYDEETEHGLTQGTGLW